MDKLCTVMGENCRVNALRLPDLEVDWQTPLGHEGVVSRMSTQPLDTGLRPTLPLKPLNKLHSGSVLL